MRPALFAAAALLAGALGSSAVEAQTSRPNIVVILADDAGYADFAFSRAISGGTSQFQSPNIDALAQQSVVARQGYVASPLCGPSRAGLLTGQYPQRFGIEENLGNDASQRFGFDGTERLLSHRLKELGYATGMTGKWHGGFVPGVNRPNDMGFDHFFGFLSGSRQYYADVNPANLMYRNQVNVESTWRSQGDASQYDPVRGRYVTDAFGEESASFITQHAAGGNPFFLYASFTAPHTPLTAKQADLDRFSHIANAQDRTLAAMVYSLDRAVGRIVDALTASGAMDNTIIAFLNDNGGTANSNNGVFRDYKGKTHEGGIRVPFFLKMPGVAPGTYEQPISTMDLVPTLLAAAGGAVSMAETDGVNLLPYFNGNSTAAPHETLFWRNREIWAVRKGDWKLARPHEPQFNYIGLYNVANDPGETVNLLSSQPAKAAELYREFTRWEATLAKPEYGSLGADNRNHFDHFVFQGATGATTNFSSAGAWSDAATGASATMLPDDAYANAVLEFRTRDGGNYTAANNMKRMSGQAFMLNELRLSGAFGSATPRTATISGNSVLMVKNLQGQAPRLRLDATSTAGAGKYTFQIAAPIELLDDLVVEGHGTQHFIVQGGIADYDQPRSLTKTGGSMLTLSNAATFRGDAIVLGGDLNLSGPSAALNGQRLVAVGAGATLRQSDGLIRTERLAISPQGTFAFTGGTLQAASVSGELINAGGVFAGGPQVGPVSVFGDYRQSGGSLSLDIGTSSQGALFDSLQVTGAVSLGGTLAVNLFNGAGGSFIPSAGSVYQIITAGGGVSGSFDSLQLPALPSTMSWQLQMGASSVRLRVLGPPGSVAAAPFTAAGLAIWQQHYGLNGGANEAQADWDENGVVDGSDFLVWQRMGAGQLPPTGSPGLDAWRQHFGLSSGAAQSHGDWDGNGLVDGADFLIWQRLGAEAAPLNAAGLATWRQHFGVNGGATAAQADWDGNGVVDGADFLRWQRGLVPSMQAVPEPTSAACALVVTLLLAIPRGAQRQAWSNAIRT